MSNANLNRPRPVVLVILDGWGLREERENNAVALADTPNMDRLWAEYPHTALDASEHAVGLPAGQMGNSEVGHQNMGAGFIVYQDLTRLDKSIEDGSFYENPELVAACEHVKTRHSTLHLLGLLGPGGVHSHWAHLFALLELAKRRGLDRVVYHAFTDGRDTPPRSGLGFMQTVLAKFQEVGVGRVGSVSGRYYAMDRDKRWDRVEKAYNALVLGEGRRFNEPLEVFEASYAEGVTDEFIVPAVIAADGEEPSTIQDGDGVIFFNFRSDRGREMTRAITDADFQGFERRKTVSDLYYVTMTRYEEDLDVHVAFQAMEVKVPLARVLSDLGLRQFHIAETEKYAHVTFFFNGRTETPFPGEDRVLIPSPKVATYDLQPEMSAYGVADELTNRIASGAYDFIVANFANGDMVGHSGKLDATMLACEAVDRCLGQVYHAVQETGGVMLVTADHGNAELMVDPDGGGPHTFHTTNPVPFILVAPDGSAFRQVRLRSGGRLCDLSLTILDIMQIDAPGDMNCLTLIRH
ncbi:MAG: 2,3-bisphosphoglycerate-independent phosphoglycerate mutase [Chloroflexia bacterium]|jgi:2,3-bisphosphoglycerate-independent phosphoglycerate mutase|nr:2,3-bisphosphoglycerate-independent phosphoglycerate mutase [Chloroflexia bacterium]